MACSGSLASARTNQRYLKVVVHTPQVTASHVVAQTKLDKFAVSRAVAKLVEAGHLLRLTKERDHRCFELRTTESGDRVCEDLARFVTCLCADFDLATTLPERAVLEKLLGNLQRLSSMELGATRSPDQ